MKNPPPGTWQRDTDSGIYIYESLQASDVAKFVYDSVSRKVQPVIRVLIASAVPAVLRGS